MKNENNHKKAQNFCAFLWLFSFQTVSRQMSEIPILADVFH